MGCTCSKDDYQTGPPVQLQFAARTDGTGLSTATHGTLDPPTPRRASVSALDRPWACPVCTFANRASKARCMQCRQPRERLFEWGCANCGLWHAAHYNACVACGAARPEDGEDTPKKLPAAFFDDGAEEVEGARECCVCLMPLCSRPIAGFGAAGEDGPVRVCRHFVHTDCANALRKSECPLCMEEFGEVLPLPAPSHSFSEWFRLMDFDQTGLLTKQEVIDALPALLGMAEADVAALVEGSWAGWDTDKSGKLSYVEVQDVVRQLAAGGLFKVSSP
eukprot:TRINITY_DN35884_c0_g1_i1.p1 TRINITY_DN35884_c0_g1~~TRINITY_DN35884_c0_g1_i1.p1  ORF type:complete len:277 (+),score=94.78 TRINITY_DN35884_c0_g1_i1:89-919(+)